MRRRCAVLLLLLGAPVQTVADELEEFRQHSSALVKFREEVEPLIQAYIFSNYESFAKSELTFRTLKNHVVSRTEWTYEELSKDDRSEVIETATDEIANNCNMGEVSLQECKKRISYVEPSSAKSEL